LEQAMKSGSVPEKQYRAAHEELIKSQLEGEKDIFAANSAVFLAKQSKTALERDLLSMRRGCCARGCSPKWASGPTNATRC
jgi:hypothetical protein